MKVLLLALFVAAVTAIPSPGEDSGAVEMIVNGLAEGQALDIGDIVDIKLKEHADGQVVATNLLHPYTAVGIAEAAAAAAATAEAESVQLPLPIAPEVVLPEPVVLPQPIAPEVVLPEPVVLPQPAAPEVVLPEPVILPEPVAPEVVLPEAVVLPQPIVPEVVLPEAVVLPEPVAPEVVLPEDVYLSERVAADVVMPAPSLQDGEVYNDGVVSVTVNAPEEAGVFSTLQSWFNLILNYFHEDGAQTSHQIV